MKALRQFIVEIPKTHNDKAKLGDDEIFIDTRFNEFEHRVCYGTVVSAPCLYDTGVKEGDTLFFHHHVTQNKSLALGDDRYVVLYAPEDAVSSHAIAYRNSEGELHMLSAWLFVQPIEEVEEEKKTESGIIVELEKSKIDSRTARVFMPHPELASQGVNVGDVIGFDKSSDYKMKLDDDSLVFRMKLEDISYVVKD